MSLFQMQNCRVRLFGLQGADGFWQSSAWTSHQSMCHILPCRAGQLTVTAWPSVGNVMQVEKEMGHAPQQPSLQGNILEEVASG